MGRSMAKGLVGVLILLLVACSAAPPAAPSTVAAAPPPAPSASPPPERAGWQDRVFYEIFVRSFQDSDGDGVGDLTGLIEKLDYLQGLGVRGIWLMPVAQSPSYHGYDVVDYYQIDDEYGTKEEFLRLIEEAHQRDIHVIVDLVLNHTSSEHPWFKEAQEPDSERRDWYVWAETPPAREGWHATPTGSYYGYFWEGMPDLNYQNPEVSAAMLDVVRFWLEEMQVDGFRLDAIKYLVENESAIESTPETHAWLEQFYDYYKGVDPDAYTVAEVWTMTSIAAQFVGAEVDTVFEFDLAEATLTAALRGNRTPVERVLMQSLEAFPPGQFATFLANHDQKRTRSRLLNDEQAKLAATMQLTFPGTPFIYYGEEIGMKGDKPDENIRRPMQWSGEPGGGFTTGTPWNDLFEDFETRNVAAQEGDPASLLTHYRALIALRNEQEALRGTELILVGSSDNNIFAYLRPGKNPILVLLNLHREPISDYTLALEKGPLATVSEARLLMGAGEITLPSLSAAGGFADYQPLETLPAYSSTIIEWVP